ncbi:winged helix-turn-helix transcriptional regulator [Mucilaginibacter terrae]|uniref:DNA-binding HxlR family transcriptional regulator n=1 Tax=Mucilaginibacter terrae TaxID=1955052 RepID=A0ABU3GW40_9SPHI|nr:helix-turn-helix domain-containing protein [Mucilaginibacter terrae]MDT3403982.1 DNA-binding HxlR family transcriptional regulator [Mucilaginibacter terrae]
MTTKETTSDAEICPAQALLKMLSGKWKAAIFRLATEGPLRFSGLLRSVQGANKQSLSVALRELEEDGLLEKIIIKQKPLHIEYNLTEKGRQMVSVFTQLEGML